MPLHEDLHESLRPFAEALAQAIGREEEDPTIPPGTPEPEPLPPIKPIPEPVRGKFHLCGVNMSMGSGGSSVLPGVHGTNYKHADGSWYDLYKDRGCYLFRHGFLWERVQTAPGAELVAAEMRRLETALTAAKRNGQMVILDMHNYGRYFGEVISPTGKKATPKAFANCWHKIINYLKPLDCYSALLACGLMNEPYGEADKTWFDAAQEAINAIASADPDMKVTVAGCGWSSAMQWPRVSDHLKNLKHPKGKDRIIMEAHQYLDPNSSGKYADRAERFDPMIGVARVKPFVDWCKANGFTAFLGEYGLPPNNESAAIAIRNLLDYLLKERVMSTVWCAGPWWTTGDVTALDTTHGAAGTGPLRSQLTTVMPYFTETANKLGPI